MKAARDTKTTPSVIRTPDSRASQTGPLIAYLAALAAVAGVPVHLYWALGGTWGYPGGAAAAALPGLAPVWAAAVVCVSHGLFGIATKGLYLAGLKSAVSWPEHDLTAGQKNLAAL